VPGVGETVPSYRALLVYYDPMVVGYEELTGTLHGLLAEARPEVLPPVRTVELPCCYGGELGFELEAAAAKLGLLPEELARLHAEADYYVYFVGFTPGLPYMTGMPERLTIPRLTNPRVKTPPGSVSIGACSAASTRWSRAASGSSAAPRCVSTIGRARSIPLRAGDQCASADRPRRIRRHRAEVERDAIGRVSATLHRGAGIDRLRSDLEQKIESSSADLREEIAVVRGDPPPLRRRHGARHVGCSSWPGRRDGGPEGGSLHDEMEQRFEQVDRRLLRLPGPARPTS
jgi:KipI family sensor histidine kinase inhibitor